MDDDTHLAMSDLIKQAEDYQRKLFRCLDEFFVRATGETAISFSSIRDFSDEVRRNASRIANRGSSAFSWLYDSLGRIYTTQGPNAFRLAKQLGGLKLVQAGPRFTRSHLSSVQTSLLYADTVLIPDPVAPWIESERKEERFRDILLLQNAHALLHLKPIVDADLPNLPIFVFPSWEKPLEERDPHTQQGVGRLVADTLARFVEPSIETFADAVNFAKERPEQFIQAVEKQKLIVAPGGNIGAPASEVLAQYDEETARWRSPDWASKIGSLPPSVRLLQLLFERITPQFHLFENSAELAAHPLVAVEQQAYYFKIISDTNSERLSSLGLLTGSTNALVRSLSSERMGWLSNVPLDALIELRGDLGNIEFRKRMEGAIGRLHGSAVEDIDKVTAEVCLDIEYAIGEHQKLVRKIDSTYSQKHLKTAGMAVGAFVCALVPSLAPYIGPALPFAAAAKFGWDAWDRRVEKQKQAKSLMGILATTRSQ
jgi:hypothetical protein